MRFENYEEYFRFLRYIVFLHLIRVYKLRKIAEKIEDRLHSSDLLAGTLSFCKLIAIIFYIAHIFACIWHLVGINESFN